MEKDIGRKIENKENKQIGLFYHHSRALEHCTYGIVKQQREADDDYEGAYLWLEHEVGFYPLFLAVGKTEADIQMTGYQNQWQKKLGPDLYRRRGEIQNNVLFSFADIPKGGVFTDFRNWYIVLNSKHDNYRITDQEKRMILKPSWDRNSWLRHVRNHPQSVQLVVPELDLRNAKSVSVRNKKTKQHLEQLGFTNVATVRIPIETFF